MTDLWRTHLKRSAEWSRVKATQARYWGFLYPPPRSVRLGVFRPLLLAGNDRVPAFLPDFLSDTVIFYITTTVSVVILGIAKGGFNGLGLLAVPLMALVISPVQAAAILLPVMMVQDVVSVWAYRNDFDKTNLVMMLPGSVIGIGVGWYLAASASEDVVRLLVGVIAVGFVLYHYARTWMARPMTGHPHRGRAVFWAAVSGYTSFVAHAGSPPYQVYMMPQRLQPQIYAGTATMFFAVTNFIKAVFYFSLGQFTPDNMHVSVLMLPVAVATTFLGVWLVRRFDKEIFYTLVYAMTLLIGLKLISDVVRHWV